MSLSSRPASGPSEYDPVFLHSRREALVILMVWIASLVWSVAFCYLTGYGKAAESAAVETILGIPRWVFWGVAVPWLVADVFTVWFCFGYMQDDDLGEAHEGADLAEELAREREEAGS